ncbi:DNA methyltransferase [Moraxella atlantae]|uniref:DNA methyltransferase n=1 Tax=Faucicola atlantae TaxID=34059 RepID=UPI0037516E7F
MRLYEKLSTLTFFDPACGCGNFLIIAYRELRLLENQLIAQIYGDQRGLLDISTMCRVTVEQFYGIEIEPHAAHIARVALWITDHQLNQATAERFGTTRPTTPIVYSPHIIEGNALQLDWSDVIAPNKCDYIMGNPPFIGKAYQTSAQKADLEAVAGHIKGYKTLDYVAGWYIKAMNFMQAAAKQNHHVETAFVSTNSINQGEQVAILWRYLLESCGGFINFAHQTFKWTNEGRGVAAVHCVIVGFGLQEHDDKILFTYDDIAGDPKPNKAKNINGYLINAPTVFIDKSNKQISNEQILIVGSRPTDGGFLLLSDNDKKSLIQKEPISEKYIRPFMGGEEFLNDIDRWCLWFADIDILQLNKDLEKMPSVFKRIEQVKSNRLSSSSAQTKRDAQKPHLFQKDRSHKDDYLFIPQVSSQNRDILPIGFINKSVISSDPHFTLPKANYYHFGVLSSSMHNAFMRLVAGRLKSDYRYSNTIVYNNFPYPFMADDNSKKATAARQAIGIAGQAVLDAREHYRTHNINTNNPKPTLAQLYNRHLIDPYPQLTQAHAALDKAVDKAYGYKGNGSDENRVEFLLKRLSTRNDQPQHPTT